MSSQRVAFFIEELTKDPSRYDAMDGASIGATLDGMWNASKKDVSNKDVSTPSKYIELPSKLSNQEAKLNGMHFVRSAKKGGELVYLYKRSTVDGDLALKMATILKQFKMELLVKICNDMGIPRGKIKAETIAMIYNAFYYDVCDDQIRRADVGGVLTRDMLIDPDADPREKASVLKFMSHILTKDTIAEMLAVLKLPKTGNKFDLVHRMLSD